MKVLHRLLGYDPKTDRQQFALEIPPDLLASVKQIVKLEADDPEAYDSYELTYAEAKRVAECAAGGPLPEGLLFFLESFAPAEALKRYK